MIDFDRISKRLDAALRKETSRTWDIFMSKNGWNEYPKKRTSKKELRKLLKRITK